jgi:RNA polymerase sigma factor (TIGR02999 family)
MTIDEASNFTARGLRCASAGGMLSCMSDVTRILSAIEQGDPSAAEQLLPLVYDELRKLAAQRLAQEKPGQTLQATALVHEAYLRLVDQAFQNKGGTPPDAPQFNGRAHFFAAAAEAMRRILIESARRKKSGKHGGAHRRIELGEVDVAAPQNDERWLQLDEALERLTKEDAAAAQVAKFRLFAGLSADDAADLLGISRATAFRHWTFARAWLQARMNEQGKTPL